MIPIRDDNPVQRTPIVTYWLIALCVIVYLARRRVADAGFERAVYSFGLIPAVLTGRAVLTPELQAVPPVGDDTTPLEVNVPVEVDGVGVLPGDWIFADNVRTRWAGGASPCSTCCVDWARPWPRSCRTLVRGFP